MTTRAKRSEIQGQAHLARVISGMVDKRSNPFVEAMNGLLQQAKRAEQGFRTTENIKRHRAGRWRRIRQKRASWCAQRSPADRQTNRAR